MRKGANYLEEDERKPSLTAELDEVRAFLRTLREESRQNKHQTRSIGKKEAFHERLFWGKLGTKQSPTERQGFGFQFRGSSASFPAAIPMKMLCNLHRVGRRSLAEVV